MDKEIPAEEVVLNQENIKSAAIKRKWRGYIDNSTLHGMQYVFNGQTKVRSIMWAFFLLGGMAYFSYQSSVLLKKYFSYPVTTKVTMDYDKEPIFPAVTICNFNKLTNRFKDENSDRIQKGLLEYFFRYKIQGLRIEINRSAINWSHYEDIDMWSLYGDAGHDINIVECAWKEQKCSDQNFTTINLTSMGLCHTFNSAKQGQKKLTVKNSGAIFGLRLILDVEQDVYYGLATKRAGLKVLIHDQDTPPMVEQLGFSVGPGTSTFAAISMIKVKNLPAPYPTNCSKVAIPGFSKYTTSACMLACQAKYVIKKCGCRDILLPATDTKVHLCSFPKTATCVVDETENFYLAGSEHCNCPVPCEAISYKPILSYAYFPSKAFAYYLFKETTGNKSDLKEDAESYSKSMRENRLELNVYFQDLHYLFIEQQPAYDEASAFGEIGGQLGLCIGASLLTLVEFCDVIITIIKIRLGRAKYTVNS